MQQTVLTPSPVSHEVGPVSLRTLGRLELSGSEFARPKPLLLLAYLAIEGPQERRHLAELFWPGNADGLNSLSVTLSRIRRGAKNALEADEVRVWTRLETDTQALLGALEAQNLEKALAHYQGAFLDGVYLSDWSPELEEWVYAQREAMAAKVRTARMTLAEQAAQQGQFEAAAHHAEAAYSLPGAPPLEPEDLRRLYPLLLAGKSPQAARIRQEASELGLTFNLKADEAKARFRRELLGREDELQTLQALPEGSWAWVRGGAGLGKTALLKALPGHYLQARSGLPYATLEPLLGSELGEGEGMLLRRLARLGDTLLIDGWEGADPESQQLLGRLRGLRPALRVVVASREAPSLEPDLLLELGPLPAKALQAHPGAWEATGGLPALVEAYLRGKPLSTALDTRLAALSKAAREVGLALALLDTPDPALVRRALGLSAPVMAAALDELNSSGLIEPSGGVRPRQSVLEWLEGRRTLGARLALELARQKEGLETFGLWQRARLLWEEADTPRVQGSYLAWAQELLRRGFPKKAVEALENAPDSDEVRLWRARGLERSGKYAEAIKLLKEIGHTADVFALESALYWRLGHSSKAQICAEKALGGSTAARAEAQNTLGKLALSTGAFPEASKHFRSAANLWLSIGQTARRAEALNNSAVARSELEEYLEDAFSEALQAAENHPSIKALVLLNMGMGHSRKGRYLESIQTTLEAAQLAENSGALQTAASGLSNLGHIYFLSGNRDAALEACRKAFHLAQQVGDQRLQGLTLSYLAEIESDIETWELAIQQLEANGFTGLAQRRSKDLEVFKLKLAPQYGCAEDEGGKNK